MIGYETGPSADANAKPIKIYMKNPFTLLTVICRLQQFLQSTLLPSLTHIPKHMNI